MHTGRSAKHLAIPSPLSFLEIFFRPSPRLNSLTVSIPRFGGERKIQIQFDRFFFNRPRWVNTSAAYSERAMPCVSALFEEFHLFLFFFPPFFWRIDSGRQTDREPISFLLFLQVSQVNFACAAFFLLYFFREWVRVVYSSRIKV